MEERRGLLRGALSTIAGVRGAVQALLVDTFDIVSRSQPEEAG